MPSFPPIHHADLVALGIQPSASISSSGLGVTIDPPAPWLVSRVLTAAVASPPPEDAAGYCRHVRDLLLGVTDWTQAADSPLSAEGRAAWATFRQGLRDVPAQYSGDGPIQWPTVPG